jgi:hypothetical protein
MKIKKLIQELSKYDGELDVDYVASYIDHRCSCDDYCYCTSEDHVHLIYSVDKEEVYNKKTKKQELKRVLIRGDKE